jgi:osmotically-inducible protein OsmY
MKKFVFLTIASLALLGCNTDNTGSPNASGNRSTGAGTNSTAGTNTTTSGSSHTTTTGSDRTTVAKPALSGGDTGTVGTSGTSSSSGASGSTSTQRDSDPVRPDNTKVNQRDRDDNSKTATSQSNSQKDIDVTAEIRRRILRNDNMSVNARNVKIITEEGGKVTLKGPVASEDERKTIHDIARDVAGADQVTDQMEVAP